MKTRRHHNNKGHRLIRRGHTREQVAHTAERILNLSQAREARTPHLRGRARCLGCQHEWEAVAPVGTTNGLDCPACGLAKGVYVSLVTPKTVWQCNCGNDLFWVLPCGIMCPMCGVEQEGF